jgi:hypothetical protein
MITVSLQPFAVRKIVVLIAAVLWLTSAVIFADPVFVNAHATRFARDAKQIDSGGRAFIKTPAISTEPRLRDVVQQSSITPAEGPAIFSVSLEQLDTWKVAARPPLTTEGEITFWSVSLTR